MASPPPLLTTEEVARLLRVHRKHVYRLLKRGLPARRVASEWRFDRAEVLAWSRRGAAAPSEGEAEVEAGGSPAAVPGPGAAAAPAPAPLVAANGDRVVTILLDLMREASAVCGLVQADRESGLALLQAGAVLAAGSHAGGFPTHVGAERVARIHLVTREVGLVARGEVPALRALAGLRLASRPPSAGVRRYLDDALAAAGVEPLRAHAAAALFASHLDVACAVARGDADVGVCSRAWADRLGLAFAPLAREAYGLIARARDLGDPHLVRACELAQGRRFREAVAAVPGYDPAGAGDIRYDGA